MISRTLAAAAALGVLLAATAGVCPATAATPTTWVVGTGGVAPPGSTRVARPTDVPWSALAPGSRVLLAPGTVTGPVTVTSTGTAAAPVTLDALDPARRPVVVGSVDLQGAAYVRVTRLVVERSPYAAVVIRRGSHHISVVANTLRDSAMGVDLTDGAGTGHRITRNVIQRSATNGIGVDGVASALTDRTVIEGNQVSFSGHHGMELRGSGYLVQRNTVWRSGQAIGGTSGIHLYSRGPDDPAGDDNVVRWNVTHHNVDASLYDGNGIQVDQWCDRNTVSFNLSYANDGMGINLFDGADNTITSNTVVGNGVRVRAGYRAEIGVTTAGAATDRTARNVVRDNLVSGGRAGVPGIFADGLSLDGGNTIGPNLTWHTAGGPPLQLGAAVARTTAQADRLTGVPGNLVEAPVFVDPAAPLAGGYALAVLPSRLGVPVPPGTLDLAGATASPGAAFFGAYFTQP